MKDIKKKNSEIKKQQVLPLNTTKEKFFKLYLELLKDFYPFNQLAPRERQFISLLMELKSQYKDLPKDEANELIFSKLNRDKMRLELGDIGEGTFNNLLSKMRKMNIIKDKTNLPPILDLTPDNTFQLTFYFKITE